MKSFKSQLQKYLLQAESVCPFPLEKAFAEMFVNTELIKAMENIIRAIKEDSMKEPVLIKLRKLIRQIPRTPPLHLKQRGSDLLMYLQEIKEEQKLNNPLDWVNAELEYIASKRIANDRIKGKTWWNVSDMKLLFGISKSTLYKRTGEGLDGHRVGDDLLFMPDEVDAWIRRKGM